MEVMGFEFYGFSAVVASVALFYPGTLLVCSVMIKIAQYYAHIFQSHISRLRLDRWENCAKLEH